MSEETRTSVGIMHTDMNAYADNRVKEAELIERRAKHIGGNLLFYNDPVWLVRGEGVWLFDHDGKRYLDCYNNVPSVGHCNPRVVAALTEQAQMLNTHTRYLDETIINYAEQLADTMPEGLDVCFFVCTGTEANELAMRMARAVTGQQGAVVMENSYHGNSTLIAELSTMTYAKDARPKHVAPVEPPNLYRGPFAGEASSGASVAAVKQAIDALQTSGQGLAAFLCDAIFDSQGGLEAPADYFQQVYAEVRQAGGLCIADEVQPGFARTGKMWGFEQYGVVPDIVTLGKPMGNGHPLAGVVTTKAIADRFAQSAFYFNTFGGNPVSAAVGSAVLAEIADRNLVAHVADVGGYLRAQLEALAERRPIIGNIQGRGLYQGIELVDDREQKTPASERGRLIPDQLKEHGVLVGLSGRHGNVLKVRPPLVFDRDNVDQLIEVLDRVL